MQECRKITKYSKVTEELLDEFDVSFLELEWLKKLFIPFKDDPLMYKVYQIDNYKSNKLKEFVDLEFDFNDFDYFFECYNINS
jgi:hypothetical protein